MKLALVASSLEAKAQEIVNHRARTDLDAAKPIVSLRRRKPAIVVAEPCGGHDARLQALLHNSIRRFKGEMASEERSGGGWRNAVSSPDLEEEKPIRERKE
ncbi:hypothetical protein SLEP1_g36291 [Rubroshorea leprosula]|uniref:Uncharacterized protein n=1 Tax=Rubroshorea leprosula TaxID=152421 RepID=A0AAV5KQZ6_9ROSI|nr:hypothetical protein SLEP1_g36291 [Rubroshorea leprosula]